MTDNDKLAAITLLDALVSITSAELRINLIDNNTNLIEKLIEYLKIK